MTFIHAMSALILSQILISTPLAVAEVLSERPFDTTIVTSEQGSNSLLPTYRYSEARFEFYESDYKGSQPYQDYGLTYLYGVADNTSLGTNLFWRHNNGDEDQDSKTLNPEFFLRGKRNLSADFTIFFGALFALSPEPNKDDNQYTGGNSFKGDVGFKKYVDGASGIVGFASAQYLDDRESKDDQGDITKETGRHQLQAHLGYELGFNDNRVGATVGALKLLSGKDRNAYGEYDIPEFDHFIGTIYGVIKLDQQFSIIPSLKYLTNLDFRNELNVTWTSASLSLGLAF